MLPLDFEAGVSPQTAKPRHDPVPPERVCQGQSRNSFSQKKRHPFGIAAQRSKETAPAPDHTENFS
jgi:hypothetical protein